MNFTIFPYFNLLKDRFYTLVCVGVDVHAVDALRKYFYDLGAFKYCIQSIVSC